MADAKLKQIARDAETRKHTEGLAQAVHVARTGHRVGSIPLDGIFAAWQAITRKHAQLSPAYVFGAAATFRRLVACRGGEVRLVRGREGHELGGLRAVERQRDVNGRPLPEPR